MSHPPGALAVTWAVARKDLLVELRSRERIAAMGAFAVLVGVLFNYAIDPTAIPGGFDDIAAGILWITILFVGLLGVGRTFALEEEDAALQGILATPIPAAGLFLGKVVGNYVLVMVTELLAFGVFTLFFGMEPRGNLLALGAVLATGTLAFVALATFFSAISFRSSMGETLLPLLLFPLLVPVLIYGASATHRLLAGRPFAEVDGNLRMLVASALVALAVGSLLFRFVVEE